jgi:hypothetical protein
MRPARVFPDMPLREQPLGAERRAEPRLPANSPARLFYGPGWKHWLDCTIKDRSTSGAKVQAPALFDLPNSLVLLDFQLGKAFEAQLRWRKAELAGLWLATGHELPTLDNPAFSEILSTWRQLAPGFGFKVD